MKVYLESIGCRLNQAEIDRYAAELTARGYIVTQDAQEADYVIINTCSVTSAAASDSRGRIRAAAKNPNAKIVVTGCWSETDPAAALNFPGVLKVVPNLEKDRLARFFPATGNAAEANLLPVHARGRTRSFIKVQDGCDNFCTFCVTRIARGKARSETLESIISEIRRIEDAGGKEVVLTGVNLGAWGLDFNPKRKLADLLSAILAKTSIGRVRLSSLENWNLDLDFVSLWTDTRLLPHFHLPLQSGSPTVLRRMARRTKPNSFLALIEAARKIRPEFSITTDIIVGFPGETDAAFSETLTFAADAAFSGGHVFSFSARPGTAALKLDGRVSPAIKKERSARLRALLKTQKDHFMRGQIGSIRSILWEHGSLLDDGAYLMKGLTDNYLPVLKKTGSDFANTVTPERIEGMDEGALRAEAEI